jgi:hypothetical protein
VERWEEEEGKETITLKKNNSIQDTVQKTTLKE